MKRIIAIGLILISICYLLIGCEVQSPLQLELKINKTEFSENEPIKCTAKLSYTGRNDSFSFYSGKPIIMLSIAGGEFFQGESDLINKGLYEHTINNGEPIEISFQSYIGGHLESDQEAVTFWKNFTQTKDLILPPGEYELMAKVVHYREEGTGRCELRDSVFIVVK